MKSKRNIILSVGGWSPVIHEIVQDVGLIDAAVFGEVWRHCQKRKGYCTASRATMADNLGISEKSITRALGRLCLAGYLNADVRPGKTTRYYDSGKAEAVLEISMGKAQPWTESPDTLDRESREETNKETLEKDSLSKEKTKSLSRARRSRSAIDELKSELEQYFSRVSGNPIPLRDTAKQRKAAAVRWWNPLVEMAGWYDNDIERAKRLIGRAVTHMRGEKLTVAAPQSILETARHLFGIEASDPYRE